MNPNTPPERSAETLPDPAEARDDAALARRARSRVIARNVYRAVVTLWGLSGAGMLVIWWQTTPNGYFWPAWPLLGMALAALLWGLALSSHGPFRVSARRLERELDRMRRAAA